MAVALPLRYVRSPSKGRPLAQVQLVRDINQARTLVLLRRHGSLSRAQLARRLQLTRSTLSALAGSLLAEGLVIEDGLAGVGERGGRPGTGLRLNPRGASFLGAEFSNDHMTVVGMALDGQEVIRQRQAVHSAATMDEIISQLCQLVRHILNKARRDLPALQGLGVAVPGMLERDGTVFWLPGFRWRDVDLMARLQRGLRMPIVLDNDANASAMAELLFGRREAADNFLYLLLDNGVGSGLVLDRTLYRGAHGISGEAGHMRLDPDGPACLCCGGRGCFETLVNNAALVDYYREGGGEAATAKQVLARLAAHDPAAEAALTRWATWVARGLATLLYVLNPAEVILGGTLAALVPDIVERLVPLLEAEGVPKREDIRIVTSAFGEDGAAVGAAALVYQTIFQVPTFDPDDAEVMARV